MERFTVAKHVGRHRAQGYSPLTELTQIAGDTAKPAVRATAVLAMSSGLLAGMITPAQAAPTSPNVDGNAADGPSADRPIIDILGVLGAPAAPATPAAGVADVAAVPAVGPVVTAPSSVAGLPSFGALGFQTVAAPAAARASRSTTTARTSPTGAAVPAPAAGGSIIAIAASLTGIPYRYGGSSPSTGFDCSGYTSYVYKLAKGIVLPRTADGQRRGATKVSNPVPGDLVFFGIPASHVGIYAGNGMMYHSPRTGSVTQLAKIYTSNVTYGRY